MVHAVIAHAEPGDVLVLTSARPTPYAFIGELLATQAQKRGVSPGFSSTPPCATSTSSRPSACPIWARWVRAQGATKGEVGELDVLAIVGGTEIRPGDLVVMDCDGAMALPASAYRRGACRSRWSARSARPRCGSATPPASCPTTCRGFASSSKAADGGRRARPRRSRQPDRRGPGGGGLHRARLGSGAATGRHSERRERSRGRAAGPTSCSA